MSLDDYAERNELLTQLLRYIRVQSSVFARPELGAPWGFSVVDEEVAFHIVTRGRCSLEFGGGRESIALSEGDFVVLPRGGTYVMRDAPTTLPVRLDRLLKTQMRGKDGVFRAGGNGETTRLICGNIRFEDVSADLLMAMLPPVIHLKKKGSRLASWVTATVERFTAELDARRPGADVLIARFADILFIQTLAEYLENHAGAAESGWLAALRDKQIGPALALLHRQPDKGWTVASLANELGLSRSAFAARFVRLVGEPPLHYLTRVRLSAAGVRLKSGDEKMSAIATSLGFDSVSGFNKAFKQRFGMTPGEYRGRFSARSGV